jgi:S-adenosylmethionine:tRNA ribosyltransferase-isomerase
LHLDDFDYVLPPELIAQAPPARRDDARLLVVRRDGPFEHRGVRELPALLPPDALVVVNDTRVLPARLHARKPSGGRIELLLVDPLGADVWTCLIRGQKSLAPGMVLELLPPRGRTPEGSAPRATYLGEGRVQFDAPPTDWGEIPLPPYIDRAAGPTDEDRDRYRTLYARAPGAVAAPTAGLHFTDEMLARLDRVAITLHVGPGTFAPVRDLEAHVMHEERYEIPAATAAAHAAARAAGRPIVAVGTTVVRALESALAPDGTLRAGPGATRLFIRPGGAPVRSVDLLVTNFHLPRSTLLMLVAAFAGLARVRAAYEEAVAARYRFFSYGDAMLLHRA